MERLRISHWTVLETALSRKFRSLARRAAVNTNHGHDSEVDEPQPPAKGLRTDFSADKLALSKALLGLEVISSPPTAPRSIFQ